MCGCGAALRQVVCIGFHSVGHVQSQFLDLRAQGPPGDSEQEGGPGQRLAANTSIAPRRRLLEIRFHRLQARDAVGGGYPSFRAHFVGPRGVLPPLFALLDASRAPILTALNSRLAGIV